MITSVFQVPEYLSELGDSTTTPIEDLATRQMTAKHLAAATDMPEVSMETAGMVATSLNGHLVVKTAVLNNLLVWICLTSSGRLDPDKSYTELRETWYSMLAQSVATVAIQAAPRLLRHSTLSFPLKQRTQQQLQSWVDTVKLNDTMKGLVSTELWESLMGPSESPQLLLAVKQAMAWPLDGDDLNVCSRDFLGESGRLSAESLAVATVVLWG